jgi:hypothetical protein
MNVLEYAIERGELKECMMGMGEYRHEDTNDPGPINEGSILKGFYDMYEANYKPRADQILESILKEMLNGNIKEIFVSLHYIYFQKKYEKRGLAKFSLDNSILRKVNQVIQDRKAELEATEGIEEFFIEQNVMQVLKNYNNSCKEELGFSLFQE